MSKVGGGVCGSFSLGVRREDESAVGAGRRRRYQAMKVEGDGRKLLVAVGCAPCEKGAHCAPCEKGAHLVRRARPL
jgi:hypothetical protein